MIASPISEVPKEKEKIPSGENLSLPTAEITAGLLTGCQDRPYAFGLAMALVAKGVTLDVIGGDEVDSPEFHTTGKLKFLNMGGAQDQKASMTKKLLRLMNYYTQLIRYAAFSQAKILHILWNNKFEYFDRTALMLYYKLVGKKVVLTAHNVNQARRDAHDSWMNRITLRMQYWLCNGIFVHTQKMKDELLADFDVADRAVTVIRHPINNAFPDTALTPSEAKRQLGIQEQEKTILFFGRIRPYKGLEYLLEAFEQIETDAKNYRLIIAGEPKKGSEEYLEVIQQIIGRERNAGRIISRIKFIPDEEMELYFKAGDVLVLPYKEIFQSGVLFLAYSYGLPVIATDVGSFREEIVEGQTGYLCKPGDSADMAETIEKFFESDLYKGLKVHRREIREYAQTHHSWDAVAGLTRNIYADLLGSK